MTSSFKHDAADPRAIGRAVSGMTPHQAYIAHHHAFGPGSGTDPCASNGPVSAGFPNFTADASGNASVTLSTEMAKIAGDLGAYINVHYASDPSVVPICAPVKMTKG